MYWNIFEWIPNAEHGIPQAQPCKRYTKQAYNASALEVYRRVKVAAADFSSEGHLSPNLHLYEPENDLQLTLA